MRTPALLAAVLVAGGCLTSQGNANQIHIVGNKDRVSGCKLIGTVQGWQDAEKRNRANALAAKAGVPPSSVYVLHIEGADDEAYSCPAP